MTTHTWEARTYPTECNKKNLLHSVGVIGAPTIDTFETGAHQMKRERFKAGEEKRYIIEFDWSRPNITPDWSITAWAENGAVSVRYEDGRESDKLPFIESIEEIQTTQEQQAQFADPNYAEE